MTRGTSEESTSKSVELQGSATTGPLGRALKDLGFEPSAGEEGDFDWLYAYPAARPLLEAISTRFTPECVLSVDEAESYAQICRRSPPPLPLTDAQEVAAPLLDASSFNVCTRKSSRSARFALRGALRQKLSAIQALTMTLRDAVEAGPISETDSNYSFDRESSDSDAEEEEASEIHAELHDLLDDLERMSRHNRPQIPSPTSSPRPLGESELSHEAGDICEYVEEERCENEQIVANIEELSHKLAVRPAEEPYDKELVTDPQLCKLVDNYADLRARTVMLEVGLARNCATVDALVSSTGEQLDAEGYESASRLYDDLKARAQEAEKSLASDVSKRSCQWLWDCIRVQVLEHTLDRQRNYIVQLEKYLAALVEQRIRTMCVATAQRKRNELASDLMGTLEEFEITSKSIVDSNKHSQNPSRITSPVRSIAKTERLFADSSPTFITREFDNSLESHLETCGTTARQSKADSTTADETEDSVFRNIVAEESVVFTDFRNRIGCERQWLDLDIGPELKSLVRQLEEEVSSNSVVLDTLLRNRSRIQDHNATATSANRQWIRLVDTSAVFNSLEY